MATSTSPLVAEPSATPADRFERWLAYGLWVVCVAAAALGLLYGIAKIATGDTTLPESVPSYIGPVVLAVAYGSVGLLLRLRRAEVSVGWLFLGIGLVAALSSLCWAYCALSLATGLPPGPLPPSEVAWAANALMAPTWLASAIALALLFPDGHAPAPRWGTVLMLQLPLTAIAAIGLALTPGPLAFFPFVENPHGIDGPGGQVALALTLAALGLMIATALCVPVVLRQRYLRAGELERLQLKWFAWSATVLLSAGLIEIVVASSISGVPGPTADLTWILFTLAATLVPISAVFAILRYRLYDIDRVIGRTFVYGTLTAILAGVYAASIRLFTSFFVDVTRQSSDTALVLTTLVLATTFTPIKSWLEGVAARRFRATHAPAPAGENAPTQADVSLDERDLDARIEAIAESVARRVIAEQRANPVAHDAPNEMDAH